MKDSEKILKKYLLEARSQVLKESMKQKAEIISLVKNLISQGVDIEKIKNVTEFYKYSLDTSNMELENESIFQEMKNKLEALK